MNIQFTLASRYLRGRKLRTSLTTLAVVFGVLVIFCMNILVPTMLQAFQATMLAASNQVDLTITFRTGGSFLPTVVNEVKSVNGVRAAYGFLGRPINLPVDFYDNDPKTADKISTLSLLGLEVNGAQTVRNYSVQEGRFLKRTIPTGSGHIRQPGRCTRSEAQRPACSAHCTGIGRTDHRRYPFSSHDARQRGGAGDAGRGPGTVR